MATMMSSNVFTCTHQSKHSSRSFTDGRSTLRLPTSFLRLHRTHLHNCKVVCSAASAAGSSSSDINPYEVLGVTPIEGFDIVKASYTRKRKEAERRGDEATASQLEAAYDKLMMLQLSNRKKGVTFGSFEVSKDIKYADKQPIVPWGPRCNDVLPNTGNMGLISLEAFQ